MKQIFSYFVEIIDKSDAPVVVEIGACDGFHTQIMASLLRNNGKKYTFHSFEPNPGLKKSWLSWTSHHTGFINFYEDAVGSIDGKVGFYFSNSKYYGSSSLRKPLGVIDAFDGIEFNEGYVNCVKLDTHVEKHNIKYIDFIWMDVQGAEVDVFIGAREILNKTKYIYTEYVNAEHYEGEYDLIKLHKLLGDNWVILEDYGGDVLFKNTSFS
jgi:FkbM family methyltransferase